MQITLIAACFSVLLVINLSTESFAQVVHRGLKLSVPAVTGQGAIGQNSAQLVVLDRTTLRVVDIESGRVLSTFEHKGEYHRTKGLHRNAEFLSVRRGGHDDGPRERVVFRITDHEVLGAWRPDRPEGGRDDGLTELADDGSFLVTLIHGRNTDIARVDLAKDSRVAVRHTVAAADELLDLGFAGGDPGVIAVIAHKKVRRRDTFRIHVFDQQLKEKTVADLPSWVWPGVLDISCRRHPLIAIGSGLDWAIYGSNDTGLVRRAFGRHAPQPLRGMQGVKCGTFSPDGRWFVTALQSQMPTVAIWSLYDGSKTAERRVPIPVDMVRFSMSGEYIVLCDNQKVEVYDFHEFAAPAKAVRRNGS